MGRSVFHIVSPYSFKSFAATPPTMAPRSARESRMSPIAAKTPAFRGYASVEHLAVGFITGQQRVAYPVGK